MATKHPRTRAEPAYRTEAEVFVYRATPKHVAWEALMRLALAVVSAESEDPSDALVLARVIDEVRAATTGDSA